jgi:predicted nucleic acid-binding protein
VFLLDASVWVSAADADERFCADANTLIESTEPVAALDLTFFEVANAIGVKSGRPRQARLVFDAMTARCGKRIVRVDTPLMVAALDHAGAHGLTAYDAAYVAVAKSNGWTLVSTDIADLVSQGLAVTPDAAV